MSSIVRSVSFRSYRKQVVPVAPLASHIFHFAPNELHALHGQFSLLAEMGGAQGLAAALRSDVKGGLHLDEAESGDFQRRVELYGTNVFATPELPSFLELCKETVSDPMLIILIIAGVISIGLGLADSLSHGWYEGAAIILAVVLVVLVGSINEWKQQKQLANLDRSEEADLITVIRAGKSQQIHPDAVLVGDVVLLSAGNFIPADGVIVADDSIKVNESRMTGESIDIPKDFYAPFLFGGTEVREGQATMLVTAVGMHSAYGRIMLSLAAEPEQTPLQVKLEKVAAFVGYMGTIVAVVLFIVLFGRWLHDEAIGHSVGSAELNDLLAIFVVSITIIVVAVPEGLPLAVTISLAYSMKKMYRDKIVVHKLAACETMGNATTICSDKTGTLTQNVMTVVQCYLAGQMWADAIPSRAELQPAVRKLLIEAVAINSKAWVSDDEKLSGVAPEKWAWKEGNQTEISLMSWLSRYDVDINLERVKYPVEKSCPFDSIKKQSSVIISLDFIQRSGSSEHALLASAANSFPLKQQLESQVTLTAGPSAPSTPKHGGSLASPTANTKRAVDSVTAAVSSLGLPPLQIQSAVERELIAAAVEHQLHTQREERREGSSTTTAYRRYYKGAAEVIVANCSHSVDQQGVSREMSAEEKVRLQARVDSLTKQGLRTIGFSFITYPSLLRDDDGALIEPADTPTCTFIGVVGIKDPLRPEAYTAVRACQKAGVVVRMVTGDHIETAKFIAKECGILTSPHHVAMLGEEFRAMIAQGQEAKLKEMIPRLRVLARSKPEDKEALVQYLKRSGEIVAATGDGTNDAPQLKAANVGIAMFQSGTAVAKAAAQIWILDDNFDSIVKSIMWGRAVYDNIRKFVQFQITVNIVALSIAVIGAISGYGEPLTAVQLLWVNLIMDTFAALALGTEAPNDQLLCRRPYKPDAFIISPVMWRNIACQATYQVIVLLLLLYADHFVDVNWTHDEHYTIIFNAFVWMQLWNEINSRKVNSEWNVFEHLFSNWLFPAIIVGTIAVQIIMVELLGSFANTVGLNAYEWLFCVALGMGGLPVGLLQRCIPVNFDFGTIELDDWTFDGAELNNPAFDQRRPTTDEVLSGRKEKEEGGPQRAKSASRKRPSVEPIVAAATAGSEEEVDMV